MKLQHKVNTICFHNGNSKIWTKALQAPLWKPILWISRLWRNNPIVLNLRSYPGTTGATDCNPSANFPRLYCCRRNWFSLPLANVQWLVQCTLECHWNNWLTQCTRGCHWATKWSLPGYTGAPLEKRSWNCPKLGCHWRNSSYCSLHWNVTGGTVTTHTHTGTYSLAD